jgi:hypothetical protein
MRASRGDIRSMRLNRTFDTVLVHDAGAHERGLRIRLERPPNDFGHRLTKPAFRRQFPME